MALHQAVFGNTVSSRRTARASAPRSHVLRGVAVAALLSLPVWLIAGALLYLLA